MPKHTLHKTTSSSSSSITNHNNRKKREHDGNYQQSITIGGEGEGMESIMLLTSSRNNVKKSQQECCSSDGGDDDGSCCSEKVSLNHCGNTLRIPNHQIDGGSISSTNTFSSNSSINDNLSFIANNNSGMVSACSGIDSLVGAGGGAGGVNDGSVESIVGSDKCEFKPLLSCASCRKLHRKCDKKQPKCSECLIHGRECKYTPGKNKQYIRKKKEIKKESDNRLDNSKYLMIWNQNMVPQTQFSEIFVKNSVKKQTVDIYYRKLSMGMSTVQQTKMEDLFFKNGSEELDQDEYSLSLFYSIQALCDQYMGRRDKAFEAFYECKRYLTNIYDDWESFAVACTFNYMAFFLAGEGEDELSRNYVSIVDHYFQRRRRKIIQGIPCFGNSEHYIVNNLDKKRGVTRIFFYDNRLDWKSDQKYSDLVGVAYKISTGEELPQNFVQVLDSDLNENTYNIQMAVLEEMHVLMKKSHKGRSHVPEYIQIGLLTDKVNVGLHKLEALRVVLSKNPTDKRAVKLELLKQADVISELVDHAYFPSMLSSFIFGFAVASQVHFELFFDTDIVGGKNGTTVQKDILNSLKRDLRGLRIFAAKYGRTTKMYGHIIMAIEALLTNISSQIVNNSNSKETPNYVAVDSISTCTTTTVRISSPPTSDNFSMDNQRKRDLPSAQFLASTMKNFVLSRKNK